MLETNGDLSGFIQINETSMLTKFYLKVKPQKSMNLIQITAVI